ncbi:MAG: carbon-nitrogen hydrolase family protein [Armatimonadota bacterium]
MSRHIRITTVAYTRPEPGPKWIERTRESLAAHMEQAALDKPDLVVFPEGVNCEGPVETWREIAEAIPGPTFNHVAALAAKYRTYVCLPLMEREGDHLRNTAAFIDRDGKLLGKYHKHSPMVEEMAAGVLPGTEVPAFDTDFGKITASLCFDIHFDEVGRKLAESGARLVCFVAQTRGGNRLLHWPRDYGYYIVSSYPEYSYVVDMAGRFLGGTGYEDNQVRWGTLPPHYTTTINMDRMLFHLAENQDKFPAMFAKYGAGIEIDSHYFEAHCTIASVMDDVTMEDIVAEFDLEPWVSYLNRARRERARYLKLAANDI